MFNLEQAITEWRRQMIAGGVKDSVVLDELESHLREEIQNQLRSGTSAEQAFAAAAGQVGRGDQLKVEFAKLESDKRMRARENLRRWSVIVGTTFVYLMIFGAWYLGVRSGTLEITVADIVLATGAMVPMMLFGWAGRSLAKTLPVLNENWIVVLAMVALFFGALLFRITFPAISPATLVHVQIVALWALSPMIGFGNCVSAWFDRCAQLRKKAA